MELWEARLRVKAKKFKSSIPAGMGMKLSDDLLDSLKDDEIAVFYKILNQLGLQKVGNYWERKDYYI